jgi:thioredoxin-related protein
MRYRFAAVTLFATMFLSMLAVSQTKPVASEKPQATSGYVPVMEYDPKRDASKDIAAAVKEAQRTNRNILIEIGGKWCVWCGYFDKFFAENTTLRQYRDEKFVMVKVNYSPENKNAAVISKYGKVTGYPHIFVLDSAGKLLYSEDTSKLEQGRGYNMNAVASFLKEWSPTKEAKVSE